jgi:fumarate reductase subunit D
MMANMDTTRKRSNTSSGDNGVTLSNVTIHGSRTNMKAQQQLMASVSPPAQSKYYCSARRAICSAILFVTCIYIDVVASNVATNRWNTKLSQEQKAMPLPDILHDSFELPNAEHIIHELLRELPLALLVGVLLFGFVLPYDVMGKRNGKLMEYRRYEACTRYFETRCVLELMRALSVWVTTQADPHGLHCMNIEAHSIDCIFTNCTFARCGDNLFGSRLEFAIVCIVCSDLLHQFDFEESEGWKWNVSTTSCNICSMDYCNSRWVLYCHLTHALYRRCSNELLLGTICLVGVE